MKYTVIQALLFLVLILGAQATQHKMKKKMTSKPIDQLEQKYHQNIQMAMEEDQLTNSTVSEEENTSSPTQTEQVSTSEEEEIKPTATEENEWIKIALEKQDCQEFYATYLAQVTAKLSELKSQKSARSLECSGFSTEITTLEQEIEKLELYIVWLREKIALNIAKIDKIFMDRCEAHMIFIEYYKNAKITLRLIEFLDKAVENYSFAQLKQVGNIMIQFMDPRIMTNKEAMETMLTQLKQVDAEDIKRFDAVGDSLDDQEKARTEEEIGTKQVDDNRAKIDVEEFDSSDRRLLESYKQEIKEILAKLRSNILAEIDRRQNDEIELNDKTAAFQEKMEIENSFLNQDLELQLETVANFKQELDVARFNLETCQADVEWLTEVIAAQEIIVQQVTNDKTIILANCETLLNPPINSASLSPKNAAGSAEMGDLADLPAKETSEETTQETSEETTQETVEEKTVAEEEKTEEVTVESVEDMLVDESGNKKVPADFIPKADDEPIKLVNGGQGCRLPKVVTDQFSRAGLGWKSMQSDLDSGVLIADQNNQIIETVWWAEEESLLAEDFIYSNGDNRTGEGSGDDETIDFNLKNAPENVEHIYFVVQVYDDYMVFGDVEYTVFNLYAGDIKFLTYEINPEQIPASDDTATALLVELYRNDAEGGDWFVRPVNAWVGYINQDGFFPGNDGYIRTLDFEDPSNMVPLQETLDAIKNDSPLPEYSVVAAPLE